MRQIEAGCHAIIINGNFPGNIGKEVKVLNLEHVETLKMNHKVWFVESINRNLVVRSDDYTMDSKESPTGLILDRNLMRIDGGDPKNLLDEVLDFLEVGEIDSWTKPHDQPR